MIDARYFPASGAAKAAAATISVSSGDQMLHIDFREEFASLQLPLADIKVSERFSRATRSVYLPDGAMLEVDDGAALSALLGPTAQGDSWVTRWQRSWKTVAFSLMASIVFALLGYRYGLPVLADHLAHRVPASWTEALDTAVLAQFKRMSGFEPSALPAEQQARLRARFDAVVASAATQQFATARGNVPKPTVHFYTAGNTPNAFALPGGSIVFFDGLVKLAADDDAIVGVFAHEYGHVIHRHGLRNLLRTAVISVVAAWYFGDFTTLANAAILVSQLSYSRDFENEADDAAIAIMRANGLNTKSLAALFKAMRDHGNSDRHDHPHGETTTASEPAKEGDRANEGDPAKEKKRFRVTVPEFLSTHPDIDLRIERFEKEGIK